MKYDVIIASVQVFNNEDFGMSVKCTLKKPIEGITVDKDGTRVRGNVDYLSFGLSTLTKALCQNSEEISVFRSAIGRKFDGKELSLLLIGATLTLDRTFVEEGDTFKRGEEEVTADHDMFLTDILGYRPSILTEKMLNKVLDTILLDSLTKAN